MCEFVVITTYIVSNLVSAVLRDSEEGLIKEFFYPVDYEYQGGSFENDNAKLKDLLRHQINQSL